MRLNGWHRLWIVSSSTLALFAVLIALAVRSDASRPEDPAYYSALIKKNATPYEITTPDGQHFEISLPGNITNTQFEKMVSATDAKTKPDFELLAENAIKLESLIQVAKARALNSKARESNRTAYTLLAMAALCLSLGAYFIGSAIAWIRAGFR